jgi:hypothetical protein
MNNIMPKKQGGHLNIGEVKSSILEFVLEQKGDVGEPTIRKYLFEKYDVIAQGSINRHLHDLQKHGCIELIPPQKRLRNYWNIETRTNLKNIRLVFPGLRLNKYGKAIGIIIRELEQDQNNDCFDWLKIYIYLFISVSFFNTCIEADTKILYQGSWNSYTTINDPFRHKRINDLLKICYITCAKRYPDFKVSEDMFTDIVTKTPWEIFRFDHTGYLIKLFEKYLPGLPKEIPLQISKTKLSRIEKIPEKIPDEIDDKNLVKYMLNTLQLIVERQLDYESLIHDLLLKHFFNHDILIGVDSKEEHEFVKKTLENHALPKGSTDSPYVNLRKATLADAKLISETIIKYNQSAKLSDIYDYYDEVYQAVVKYYSNFQYEITV